MPTVEATPTTEEAFNGPRVGADNLPLAQSREPRAKALRVM